MRKLLLLLTLLLITSCDKDDQDNGQSIYNARAISQLKYEVAELKEDLYAYDIMTAEVKITFQDIINALTAEIAVLSQRIAALEGSIEVPTDNECIDESLIDSDAVCTAEYAPVCGCDNVTYSNACGADSSGVTSYTEGTCN